MGILIGMDEAGYGPNLGPLVIATTVWETAEHPTDVDPWDGFSEVLTPVWKPGDDRLHLADSKEVYSPAIGLERLEATVFSAYQLLQQVPPLTSHNVPPLTKGGQGGVATNASTASTTPIPAPSPPQPAPYQPSAVCGGEGRGEGAEANASTTSSRSRTTEKSRSKSVKAGPSTGATPPGPPLVRGGEPVVRRGEPGFAAFCDALCLGYASSNAGEACLRDADLPLPTIAKNNERSAKAAEYWRTAAEHAGVHLRDVRCDIIWPRRWNAELERNGNKAAALTTLSLELLRSVWEPGADTPALIVCDKHGGRNRYDPYLQAITGDEMIFRLRESKDVSRYRIGRTEIQFRKGGESHLPVALASMFAKYVRELSMELFNRYWAMQVPGIRPTKGYPTDAKRFRAEIAEAQASLGISDVALWRSR